MREWESSHHSHFNHRGIHRRQGYGGQAEVHRGREQGTGVILLRQGYGGQGEILSMKMKCETGSWGRK